MVPTTRLKPPATAPIATYSRSRAWLETKPTELTSTIPKFEMSRPRTKAKSIGMPSPALDAPPTAAIRSTWVPVSAPTPWIIPTPNDVRAP